MARGRKRPRRRSPRRPRQNPAPACRPPPVAAPGECPRCFSTGHPRSECRRAICCRRCRFPGHVARDCTAPRSLRSLASSAEPPSNAAARLLRKRATPPLRRLLLPRARVSPAPATPRPSGVGAGPRPPWRRRRALPAGARPPHPARRRSCSLVTLPSAQHQPSATCQARLGWSPPRRSYGSVPSPQPWLATAPGFAAKTSRRFCARGSTSLTTSSSSTAAATTSSSSSSPRPRLALGWPCARCDRHVSVSSSIPGATLQAASQSSCASRSMLRSLAFLSRRGAGPPSRPCLLLSLRLNTSSPPPATAATCPGSGSRPGPRTPTPSPGPPTCCSQSGTPSMRTPIQTGLSASSGTP
ncbi:hypothetical protein VPH35_036445 [Triticum aestivum]